jgi:hypothetical protein
MGIDELIAALEGAAEGRQGLDNLCAPFFGWHRVEPRFHRSRNGVPKCGWISPEEWRGENSDGSPILDSLYGTSINRDAPGFTRSIDAALSGIPKDWLIDAVGADHDGKYWGARFKLRGGFMLPLGIAVTAPLAICAARLRAIKAMEAK